MSHPTQKPRNILSKTLGDLLDDLQMGNPDAYVALQPHVQGKREKHLVRELKNSESQLCRAIPVTFLSSNDNGLKYLEILKCYNASLGENTVSTQNTTVSPAGASPVAVPELSDLLKDSPDIKDMMEDMMRGLNLEDKPMDMNGLLELTSSTLPTMMTTMVEKINNKQIDPAAFVTQSQALMQSMNALMASNVARMPPEMVSMMDMLSNTSTADPAAMLNALNATQGLDMGAFGLSFLTNVLPQAGSSSSSASTHSLEQDHQRAMEEMQKQMESLISNPGPLEEPNKKNIVVGSVVTEVTTEK